MARRQIRSDSANHRDSKNRPASDLLKTPGARSRVAKDYAGVPAPQIQRSVEGVANPQSAMDDVATVAVDNKDSGRPPHTGVRNKVEAHLGADLSAVRVHDDALANQASAAMGARAFAHGRDIFLGPGETDTDVELIAHEMTHVVQQGAAARPAVDKKVEVGAAHSPAEAEADSVATAVASGEKPTAILVDDPSAALAPGQMPVAQFLCQLQDQVTKAAEDELGTLGSVMGCPYIDKWFSHFRGQSAAHCERAIRKYLGGGANTAAEWFPLVVGRVRQGVRQWAYTGKIPADAATLDQDAARAARAQHPSAQHPSTQPLSPLGPSVQRLPIRGGSSAGNGAPIDASAAAKIGDVYGDDFSDVRVHTDAKASRWVETNSAKAITQGTNIAFAHGTYQPNTPEGDALLAHELAHVSQQRGASASFTNPQNAAVQRAPLQTSSGAHEQDADQATIGALAKLHGKRALAKLLGPSPLALAHPFEQTKTSKPAARAVQRALSGQQVRPQQTSGFACAPAQATNHPNHSTRPATSKSLASSRLSLPPNNPLSRAVVPTATWPAPMPKSMPC